MNRSNVKQINMNSEEKYSFCPVSIYRNYEEWQLCVCQSPTTMCHQYYEDNISNQIEKCFADHDIDAFSSEIKTLPIQLRKANKIPPLTNWASQLLSKWLNQSWKNLNRIVVMAVKFHSCTSILSLQWNIKEYSR